MKIVVKLHARAADLAGAAEAPVDVADTATCADVKLALADSLPALGDLVSCCALATDREYLRDSSPAAGALHLIPPVSGG